MVSQNGFNDSLLKDLSLRVKDNTTMQRYVNRKLSQRIPFWLLFTDLVAKILSFGSFIVWSDMIVEEGSRGILLEGFFIFLCICASFLAWRELVQLLSQKVEYFLKREKLIELTTIFCMVKSVLNMQQKERGESFGRDETTLYMFTVIFLAILIVISLRSTFLPFAQFFGGIIAIFYTLFPFFVVSTLVLLTFTYIYRMHYALDNHPPTNYELSADLWNYELSEQLCGRSTSFYECFSFVLHGFFHGFEEPNSRIDIGFGVFVIIILLTVVIAIVGDAWKESQKSAAEMYWQGRLVNVLLHIYVLVMYPRMCQ